MNKFMTEMIDLPSILLKVDHTCSITGSGGLAASNHLTGDIVFRIKNFGGDHSDLDLLRLGLVGHDSGAIGAGEISVAEISGSGTLQATDENSTTLSLSFSAYVLTDAIISTAGFPVRRDDVWLSPWEKWEGSLSGTISAVQGAPAPPLRWHLSSGALRLWPSEISGSSALIQEISASLANVIVYPAKPSLPGCPAGYGGYRRTLFVRPVFFELPSGLTGGSSTDQLTKASELWGGCCIKLEALASKTITKREIDAKGLLSAIVSGDVEKIASIYTDAPNIVEVFFVKNRLGSYGGGVTLNGGASQVKIVVTDQYGSNLQLLAHEFGHTFRGDHPSSTDTRFWPGDNDTVLNPGHPNPDKNTFNNCQRATNPALATGQPPVSCCLNPGGN